MKSTPILLSALALALCLSGSGVQAQQVYRCGNAYSQTPCPQGGQQVDADDTRSAQQIAEARRVADDEKRLAAEMRGDRLASQRANRPVGASSLDGAPARAASAPVRRAVVVKQAKQVKPRRAPNGDFVALDPGARKRRANP